MKMRRCEDEKVRYRPPLLEEPCAQTLSGKKSTLVDCGLPKGNRTKPWQPLSAAVVFDEKSEASLPADCHLTACN